MKTLLAIWLLLCPLPLQADLSQLEYLTEHYPPYNYQEEGKAAGLAVEILKLVWQQSGTPEQPIRVVPWARGYYLLTQKPNVVLFSTARTAVRDPLFKWACPIGYSEIVLLALAKRNLTLTDESTLHAYTYSAVRFDVSEQLLLNRGLDDTRIMPANRLSQALRMLLSGRVDLVAAGALAAQQAMQELKVDPTLFHRAYTLSAETLCYAFNQSVNDETVNQFQQALTKVLASEQYQPLYKRFFP
ncbi:substrate-binding periplasmic protein [Aeromonas diversa]|uniref:substrate-binding periplasmic protein n=1 Tax=Aeromonas diversa TaxID=502790 RepID=UPI0034636FD7